MRQSLREIMAPAGGGEQLLAAVRCGAGAVYLGAKRFNARRNAANFDDTDLSRAVAYCHGRNVRVYVTVNTLVLDGEREALEREAAEVAASGADAVIIQDMSVLRLFLNRYPGIRRYASTQTAVHNVDGARFLQDVGFDSVVLARELTLSEMEKICAAVPLKMEAFVHGAHCMSLSGACYLSAMLGGRSGNRGLCAQPCRLDWTCGEKPYALSLKDMSLIGHINEMAEAGVDAFKIEGRMKRPEYVAAAVTACKNALAGQPYDMETLKAVFSRSGFTDGYLTGKRNGDMFGYRTREDVAGAEGVLKSLSNLYRGETPLVPVDMDFSMTGEGASLLVTDGTSRVTAVSQAAPEIAQRRPLDGEGARRYLDKTGGTPFYLRNFQAELKDGLTLPAAALNAMRREALDGLLAVRSEPAPHPAAPYRMEPVEKYASHRETPGLWARFSCPRQITREDAFERILLPVERVTPALIHRYGDKLTAELPTLLFPEDEEELDGRVSRLVDAGLQGIYANNIYGLALGKRLGCPAHGGFGLNIVNTEALNLYAAEGAVSVTLSFEPAMGKLRALGGSVKRGVVSYGYLPLMHVRNCPVRAALGCEKCGGKGKLTDRLNIDFPVECREKRYATLLNSVPLDIGERDMSGLDFQLLYFTREEPGEAEAILRRFQRGQKTQRPHTGGLYYRELL